MEALYQRLAGLSEGSVCLQGMMLVVAGLVIQLGLAAAQIAQYDPTCPKNWVQYEDACYRFVRSPVKRREAAREACQVSMAVNCCYVSPPYKW